MTGPEIGLDISTENSDNGDIAVPFNCANCGQDVEATADPLAILFGAGTVELICPNCETTFQANITVEGG